MSIGKFWEDFCKKSGIEKDTKYEGWQFGGEPDNLANLVLRGIKTATASGADLYELDGDEFPNVGDYSIILDSKDNPVCVIRTTKVYVEKFKNVSKEHAYKEGEGDRSLEYWRMVHKAFFTSEYKEYGLEFNEDINVLCEEFEVLYY